MNGRSVLSSISMNNSDFMIPSKMQMPVLPLELIPAHTWTIVGCFGLGLGLGASPRFLHANLRWLSSCTVHSSVQITSSNDCPRWRRAQSYRFFLLTSLINWLYALPLNVHPRVVQHLKTVRSDMKRPFSLSSRCSWWAVVSSSALICCSTMVMISAVIFEGLPDPGHRAIDPVAWYTFKNLWIPTLEHCKFSWCSSFLIVEGL